MLREAVLAAAVFWQGMPVGGGSATGGSGPVSPSVIATDMCVVDLEGKGTLELLVLWRGSPGWFRRERSGAGGSGGGGAVMSPDRSQVRTAWLSEGGVELSVRFDPVSRKVRIQDQEFDLNDANVILVDEVDAKTGPRVVGVLKIDPSYHARVQVPVSGMREGAPASPMRAMLPVPVQTFIRRSPELIEFLRCDIGLPDAPPEETRAFERWCAEARQP